MKIEKVTSENSGCVYELVSMSAVEAWTLLHSLAKQLESNNPNDRAFFRTEKGFATVFISKED